MNISLTPELENLVLSKVKTGLYNSSSEVVREALRLLKEQDQLQETIQHWPKARRAKPQYEKHYRKQLFDLLLPFLQWN